MSIDYDKLLRERYDAMHQKMLQEKYDEYGEEMLRESGMQALDDMGIPEEDKIFGIDPSKPVSPVLQKLHEEEREMEQASKQYDANDGDKSNEKFDYARYGLSEEYEKAMSRPSFDISELEQIPTDDDEKGFGE